MTIKEMMYFSKDSYINDKFRFACEEEEDDVLLPNPFQNIDIKEMINLAQRIEVRETNHGHSSYLVVNEEVVNDNDNNEYVSLLYFVKFMGKLMEEYYRQFCQMRILGFAFPDIYTYLNRVVKRMKETIQEISSEGERVWPKDIIEALGFESERIEDSSHELYAIIDLLGKEKEDLSEKATHLLKLLEVPEEEVQVRRQKAYQTLQRNEVNIKSFLEDKLKEEQTTYQK